MKVLSRGGQDLKAVGRHIDYLRDREEGELIAIQLLERAKSGHATDGHSRSTPTRRAFPPFR